MVGLSFSIYALLAFAELVYCVFTVFEVNRVVKTVVKIEIESKPPHSNFEVFKEETVYVPNFRKDKNFNV